MNSGMVLLATAVMFGICAAAGHYWPSDDARDKCVNAHNVWADGRCWYGCKASMP